MANPVGLRTIGARAGSISDRAADNRLRFETLDNPRRYGHSDDLISDRVK